MAGRGRIQSNLEHKFVSAKVLAFQLFALLKGRRWKDPLRSFPCFIPCIFPSPGL